MRSGWLTLLMVACLYGAYCLYTAIVSPLTAPELLPERRVDATPATEIRPLSIAGRVARTHLTSQDWVADAKIQWQRGDETFLFFDQQMRIEDDKQNRMRVWPFALVWIDTRRNDSAAYTLVCDSAEIEFESKVQIGDSNPGRIIRGQLQGNVRITGPDNLQIVGQNFYLDEEAQRLYSDHAIRFAYGPRPDDFQQVRGQAGQIDIKLKEATESLLGHDMPRLGGLRQIALRRNVRLDLVMDDHDTPAPVTIDCKQEFTYDVESLIATFNDDVRVRRATHLAGEDEQYDWLQCDRLQLRFEEKRDATRQDLANGAGVHDVPADSGQILQTSAATARRRRSNELGITLDLDFRSLWAIGRRVVLGSDENDLTARMEGLQYDVVTRTVEMRDDQGQVEAHHRSDILKCPFIRLRHDEDDQIDMAECLGAGSVLRHDPETQQVVVESHWTKRLLLEPDAETALDVLEISGEARVLQPVQQTGIIADEIRVWLDAQTLQSSDGDLQTALTGARGADELPVKRVLALENVALVSPTLHLEVDQLEAEFITGQVSPRGGTASMERGSPGGTSTGDPRAEQPVVVTAAAVETQLVFDPVTQKTDVVHLNANDRVSISRASAAEASSGEDPFFIEASTLELRNRDGGHVLRLLGSPARIRHPEAEIEGDELYFDRGGNRAKVEGAGALSLLVESDLEGHPLEVPQPLTVRWEEQMEFDGVLAVFFGRVRTTLADSNLLCGRMGVSLNRRLSFADDRPQADGLEIDRIECHDGVIGEYHEWEGTSLVGIRKVQVAEFVVERGSGDIQAQGPGRIDDWRKGGQRRHVRINADDSPDQSSRSDSKLPWEYTRVRFAGQMAGNQTDRFLTLNDRVRVMHGPVENALDTIDRDEFSQETERAKNAIWIGSDVLQVRLVPGEGAEAADTVSVLARGNAELEGKVFRARADSISYDESKEMFTLKGRGSEASLWQQDQPGSLPREASAKTIQFVPSKHQLTLDGTRRIGGSR